MSTADLASIWSSQLTRLYTASVDEIKELIGKTAADDIQFIDNIVATSGPIDYFAQFKSLRSLFSSVIHTVQKAEVVEVEGSKDVELRIENTQDYVIRSTTISLKVLTTLSLREQQGEWRCYKHVDVWQGKPASFMIMRRGMGAFSSMLVRAFIK